MGCDMVVALARATTGGCTLLGHNSNRPARERQALVRVPGRAFAPGEMVRTEGLELPQVRQTYTVLGSRSASRWGFQHGLNEHGVAIGVTSIRTRLDCEGPALTGPDLVRVALERSTTARRAVDLITSLITRHGQGAGSSTVVHPSRSMMTEGTDPLPVLSASAEGHDNAFLIADGREAYAVEACGRHWAVQEVREVRAMSDTCHVRQDWDGISPGLADLAISRGWWPADGSKLDFAGAVGDPGMAEGPGLRRWGRATLLLEQQNGHIDAGFVRRLLADHFEGCHDEFDPAEGPVVGTWDPELEGWDWGPEEYVAPRPVGEETSRPVPLCQHATGAGSAQTAASLVAQLGTDPARLPMAWCAFGPPCTTVFFPVVLVGELPGAFSREPGEVDTDGVWRRLGQVNAVARLGRPQRAEVRQALTSLQSTLDQEAEEFASEAATLSGPDGHEGLRRLAGSFMQHNLERFEECWAELMERDWVANRVPVSSR
jgi:dipeptidase